MQTEIRILFIKLKNFKGIPALEIACNGEDIDIYGDNGTGKTTIADAFYWLIWDKDSQGKKDFEIKTLDANGKEITGLEHEVEAVLTINGAPLKLRKVHSEVWTRKRGSADLEYSGNTIDHFINDVPVKKGEYTAKVNEIANEEVFKLVTNPMYFNVQMSWQDRRKVLLAICGDITDAEVIDSNQKLVDLTTILQGRKLEDHRKIIAARRAEVNKELEKIPTRIDEVQLSMPEMPERKKQDIQWAIDQATIDIAALNIKLSELENGGAIVAKRKELAETETDITKLQNDYNLKNEEERMKVVSQQNDLTIQIDRFKANIDIKQETVEGKKKRQAEVTKSMVELRNEWYAVNSKTFEFTQEEICPTCGQAIPAEKQAEAREKALNQFNIDKATALEQITQKGIALKEGYEVENKRIADAEAEITELQAKKKTLEAKKETTIFKPIDNPNESKTTALLTKQQKLKKEIEALENGDQGEKELICARITEINANIQSLGQDLLKFSQKTKVEERIEELKQEQKKLAREFERLEKELFLVEEFVRTKVNLLDQKINSKFQVARFKLFEEQVNGGLADCCETLSGGVPFSRGLNLAGQINTGLDIINTLSEHYGVVAPIFVDNAGEVTKLLKTRGQTIRLVVSEQDKTLNVKTTNETNLREAINK